MPLPHDSRETPTEQPKQLSVFGARVRRMRTERGLSLARLAELTHYSKGYLSKIETGAKSITVDLARHLDNALDAQGQLVEIAEEMEQPICPYRGLLPFGTADADWFFGREQITEELVKAGARAVDDRRPVLLVGPSGVGKSSLLRAGLLPALARDALPGSSTWAQLILTPTATPIEELRKHCELVGNKAGDRLVVVDQFEEVFTLCEREPDRITFIQRLTELAAGGRALVVICLRADFYDRCLAYPELLAAVRSNQVTLGPMTEPQLRSAISEPAKVAGLLLEPGLVELLLSDAGARDRDIRGALPLLSHALLATWQHREGDTLTIEGYRQTGGIENAIAETAERVYHQLDSPGRVAARQLLLRLVHIGAHEQDTRRPAERESLLRRLPETGPILQALAAARLLTVDAATVHIAHEALLHAWPRLGQWIESDRSGLRIYQQLTESAESWDREGRDPSLLYRGPRLQLAEEWARAHDNIGLGIVERDFLRASIQRKEAAERARRRRTRQLRWLTAGMALLTGVALTATAIAIVQNRAAQAQRDIAVSRQLATEADQLRQTDPALATQLSLAAYRIADTTAARSSLLNSSGSTPVTKVPAHTGPITQLAFIPNTMNLVTVGQNSTVRLWNGVDTGHPRVRATIPGPRDSGAVAISPHSDVLAVTGDPTISRLWHLDPAGEPHPAGLLDATSPGLTAAFGAGGRLLAVGHADGTVTVWDVADSDRPGKTTTPPVSPAAVRAVAFSPAAPVLATAGDDFRTRLWDLSNPRSPALLTTLEPQQATIRTAVFSPDGQQLAVGSDDHSVQIWQVSNARQPTKVARLSGHSNAIRGLSFSQDGATIATAADDQTVRLWRTTGGAALTTLRQPAPARGAAFAPGGRLLVTGDDTGALWLWHLPPPMINLPASASAVAYRPQHDELAIGGADGHIRLWSLDESGPGANRGASLGDMDPGGRQLRTVVYNPHGDLLAAAGDGSAVWLWSVANPRAARLLDTITTPDASIEALAFAPDGRTLAIGGTDRTPRLWLVTDLSHPTLLSSLPGHQNTIRGLAFSPDGKLLASASDDYTIRLWNVGDGRAPTPLARLGELSNAVNSVEFSPNGRELATAGDDHTVRLWDVSSPTRPTVIATLTGHGESIDKVTYSPDGRLLASASEDGTARLWDVTNPRTATATAILDGHTDAVFSLAFSSSGNQLATASDDHSVRLWITDAAAVARQICALPVPPLSPEQWNRYVGDLTYRPLCP